MFAKAIHEQFEMEEYFTSNWRAIDEQLTSKIQGKNFATKFFYHDNKPTMAHDEGTIISFIEQVIIDIGLEYGGHTKNSKWNMQL